MLVKFIPPPYLTSKEYYEKKQIIFFSGDRYTKSPEQIRITLFELELLQFLANQKLLSSKQLFTIYNAFHPIKEYTLRTKLKRWAKKDIVFIRNDSVPNIWGKELNFYRIGQEGLKLLVNKAYLPNEWMDVDLNEYSSIKNIEHYSGQQDVVINLIASLKKSDIFVESIRPPSIRSYDEIVPDWLLHFDDTYIYVEFDTGTESLVRLQEKMDSYLKKASNDNASKHILLFALLDRTFYTIYKKNYKGGKRIANIKQYLTHDDDKHLNNFSMYVGHMGRTYDMIRFALDSDGPFSNDYVMDSLINRLTNKEGYTLRLLDNEEVYQKSISSQHYADAVYEVLNSAGHIVERIAVIVGEEGSERNMYRIKSFNDLIEGRLFLKSVRHRLIAIYRSNDELTYDYHGIEYGTNVLFTDLQSLEQDKEAIYYRYIGPYSTKVVAYEE